MDKLYCICVCLLFITKCTSIPLPSDLDQSEDEKICKNEKIPNSKTSDVISFQMRKPVDPFIGRVSELSIMKSFKASGQPVVILGAKSIGKTELARKYAMEFKSEDPNTSLIWIDSESLESMSFSFKDLASYIGIDITDKSSSEIIQETFDHFANKRTLFIFDNAESDNYVINNIPKFITRKPLDLHYIVTSRDYKWSSNKFKLINLNVFTEDEALEFLSKNLAIENKSEVDMKNMAKLLRYIPLALSKAAKYMKDQNEKKEYSINDFISEYLDIDAKKTPSQASIGGFEDIPESVLLQSAPELATKDVFEELGLRPTVINVVTSVRPPTGQETQRAISRKIEEEVKRVGNQVTNEARRVQKKVGKFFRGLRSDVTG